MSSIQIDWLGVIAFILPPIAYLVTATPYTRKDDEYYMHFANASPLFPKGRARIIFSIAWTCIFVLEGVAMYLFWHNADTSTVPNGNTYNAGLVLYVSQLLMCFAWMNMFFKARFPRWVSFVVTLIIMLCVIGVLVCSVLLGVTFAIVAFSVFLAWMVYATILSFVATFYVPEYKGKNKMDPDAPMSALPAFMDASGAKVASSIAAATATKPGRLVIPSSVSQRQGV